MYDESITSQLGNALWRVAGALAIFALPVFLLTFNVRLVATTAPLYTYGFSTYDIPSITSISMEELEAAAAQTRAYFQNNDDELRVVVKRFGKPFDLYNEREVAHMRDVKELFQRVHVIEDWSGGYLLALLGIGLWLRRGAYVVVWLRAMFEGALFTGGLVLLAGVGALIAFRQLFLLFHLLSFSNDLWQLNPARDFLIMMYPAAFFRDAVLAVGALALLEAALVSGLAALIIGRVESLRRAVACFDPVEGYEDLG